ncbi:MAG: hypothetical protein ACOYB3_01035 [Azonexus sp.]
MSSTKIDKDDIKKAIVLAFQPIQSALEKIGYTVSINAYAARFDFQAGGHVQISSQLRKFWSCQLRLFANHQTGAIERVTVMARPARTVTLKYTEKALPGILERIAASFSADIEAEAQRHRDHEKATAWAIQALKDTKGLAVPECLIPSWCRDTEDANQRFSHLHKGMARTPIGRYFPHIDEQAISGPEGLNANQLRYLIECLNKLPHVK